MKKINGINTHPSQCVRVLLVGKGNDNVVALYHASSVQADHEIGLKGSQQGSLWMSIDEKW